MSQKGQSVKSRGNAMSIPMMAPGMAPTTIKKQPQQPTADIDAAAPEVISPQDNEHLNVQKRRPSVSHRRKSRTFDTFGQIDGGDDENTPTPVVEEGTEPVVEQITPSTQQQQQDVIPAPVTPSDLEPTPVEEDKKFVAGAPVEVKPAVVEPVVEPDLAVVPAVVVEEQKPTPTQDPEPVAVVAPVPAIEVIPEPVVVEEKIDDVVVQDDVKNEKVEDIVDIVLIIDNVVAAPAPVVVDEPVPQPVPVVVKDEVIVEDKAAEEKMDEINVPTSITTPAVVLDDEPTPAVPTQKSEPQYVIRPAAAPVASKGAAAATTAKAKEPTTTTTTTTAPTTPAFVQPTTTFARQPASEPVKTATFVAPTATFTSSKPAEATPTTTTAPTTATTTSTTTSTTQPQPETKKDQQPKPTPAATKTTTAAPIQSLDCDDSDDGERVEAVEAKPVLDWRKVTFIPTTTTTTTTTNAPTFQQPTQKFDSHSNVNNGSDDKKGEKNAGGSVEEVEVDFDEWTLLDLNEEEKAKIPVKSNRKDDDCKVM